MMDWSGKPLASANFALTILLFGIAVSIPLWLHTGEVALGTAIQYHVPWSENFARQLWSGELYPRWLESMNGGLGSPTFFFYPPLPFYVSSLFYTLTLITGIPWFAVAAAATTAMIASGFAAYAWLRSFATPRASLIAAIFYMALPYHLGADLYTRFAYAELWSFVWMPLILRASRPERADVTTFFMAAIRTCVRVAIPYALLSVTHLPTLLLFSAVPALQAIFLSSPQRRFGHVLGVFSGMVLGFALAAVYTVPAWGDRAFISTAAVHASGASLYVHSFLINATRDVVGSSLDWFERSLDLWICLVLAFTVYVAMLLRKQECRPNREAWFWVFVALGSVLITTPIAKPAWRSIPVIQTVEFPWKFGPVSTMAVTALLSWVLTGAQSRRTSISALEYVGSWTSVAFLALSVLAFSWVVFWYTSNIYRYPIPWLVISVVAAAFVYCREYGLGSLFNRNDRRPVLGAWLIGSFLILANIPHMIPHLAWHLDTFRNGGHSPNPTADDMRKELVIAFDSPEYKIHTVQSENFNHEHISRLRDSILPVTVLSGSGTVSVVDRSARRNTFDVDATTPVAILLRRYFYPGTAFLDSSGEPLGKVTSSADEGLVLAELPAGHYRTEMVLVRSANEKLGLWISCIAIVLCLVLTLRLRARRHADS